MKLNRRHWTTGGGPSGRPWWTPCCSHRHRRVNEEDGAERHPEIDRQLDNPGDVELTCRELDDGRILGVLRPTHGGRERKAFVVSERDEDGEVTHEWAEDLATESFFTYIMLYGSWANPTHGAVSPAMSEFFAFCHPDSGLHLR
jgi:hypothetical protein